MEDSGHLGEMVKGWQFKNLFSKHQHIKWLRRKRPFRSQSVCVLSCSWQFSELIHLLLQHLPGTSLLHSRVTHLQNIYTEPFTPKWFWKIIFVPALKWYCNILLETLSEEGIKGSKGRKGLWFFSFSPASIRLHSSKPERTFYESFLLGVKCQYPLTLQETLKANPSSSLVVTLDGPTTEANSPGNTCWTGILFPSSTQYFLQAGRCYFKIMQ